LAVALSACVGGSDASDLAGDAGKPTFDLSQSTVTSIPPGNAQGSALSGDYQITVYTTSCAGTCPLIDGISSCDVGHESIRAVQVTQVDGRLQTDDDELDVSRLVGGINADGSFDIGGFATQKSSAISVAERVTGTVGSADEFHTPMNATVQERATGMAEGTSLDCLSTYSVSGTRVAR
jgi:hypothetical protein